MFIGVEDQITVGVDVGGPLKGFHGVALQGRRVLAKTRSGSAATIAQWCREVDASVVAVDAPCRWRSPEGESRLAEREMARERIASFSTPTLERARGHPFFSWMMSGAELYAALAESFPIYTGATGPERVAIETFPHAVACALAGQIVPAKRKNETRRELLRLCGIDPSGLVNIDEIDAALCSLTGERFTTGDFKAYGDAESGFIVVPKAPVAGFVGSRSKDQQAASPARTTRESPSSFGEMRFDSAPIFDRTLTWSSAIGLFLLNFGHLEFLVLAYLEKQLGAAELERVRAKPFSEKVERVGGLFGRTANERGAFAAFIRALGPVRELRNHLAHGYLQVVRRPETVAPVIGITRTVDFGGISSEETRHLTFDELVRALSALKEVTEEFGRLTDSEAGWRQGPMG
ncbi:MAG: DUF429 domain-containing protein [Verrucomicrobia bacterium]|nr:DUF429 domain-containing protein [Verrucomicrobiota bacterium]